MLTYLIIGVIIQVLIVVIRRFVRKLATFEGWEFTTWIMFLSLCLFNIVIWPVTIVAEVVNTARGV